MLLHAGSDVMLHGEDIIGIFDIENSSVSKYTKEFLRKKQQNGKVISITYDLPKSFIVTEKEGKEKVYLSQLAPTTLKKRGSGL